MELPALDDRAYAETQIVDDVERMQQLRFMRVLGSNNPTITGAPQGRPDGESFASSWRGLAVFFTASASVACGAASHEPVTRPASSSAAVAKPMDLATAFHSWSLDRCPDGAGDCGPAFAKAAGIAFDPRTHTYASDPRATDDNPDPVWLPGWGQLPIGKPDVTFAALALGASRRAWLADCYESFDGFRKELEARHAKVAEAIASAQKRGNGYERIDALIAIPKETGTIPSADPAYWPTTDAARFESEAAIARAFADTGRGVLYRQRELAPTSPLRASLSPELERDGYCMAVARGAVMRPSPTGGSEPVMPGAPKGTIDVSVFVRPLLLPASEEAVKKELLRLHTEADALFAMRDEAFHAERVEEMPIQSIARGDKGGFVITLFEERKHVPPTADDCARARVVDAQCATLRVDVHATRILRLSDLPRGLDLRAGDLVSAYGVKNEDRRVDRDTGYRARVVETTVGYDRAFLSRVVLMWGPGTKELWFPSQAPAGFSRGAHGD